MFHLLKKIQQLSEDIWLELGRNEPNSQTITKKAMFNFWHGPVQHGMWVGM